MNRKNIAKNFIASKFAYKLKKNRKIIILFSTINIIHKKFCLNNKKNDLMIMDSKFIFSNLHIQNDNQNDEWDYFFTSDHETFRGIRFVSFHFFFLHI